MVLFFCKHVRVCQSIFVYKQVNSLIKSSIIMKGSRKFGDKKNERHLHNDGSANDRQQTRHPPHLRGREIGLFYAKKNAMKRNKEEEEPQPIPISVDERKIQSVLQSLQNKRYKEIEGKSAECSTSSSFMWKYWTHMHDSENIEKGIYPESRYDASQFHQDQAMDVSLLEELQGRQQNSSYRKMQQIRRNLPAYKMKKSILDTIDRNQVVLLTGETGCGKTTQVPQFVLDHYIESGQASLCRIVCTQPRRISAISVAERVANERDVFCGNGSEIGFQIRLESKQPRDLGSILYCTTGIIFQRLQSDPLLSAYTHVFVDEVHERDLLSDFLLIVLKDLLPKRPDLKVVLMSATLDADTFSVYFGNCPRINIEGFTYPVEVFTLEDAIQKTKYVPDVQNSRMNSKSRQRQEIKQEELHEFYHNNLNEMKRYSLVTLDILHNWDEEEMDLKLIYELLNIIDRQKEGAVLVFLTGWDAIKKLHTILLESGRFSSSKYLIIPLHSLMSTVNQRTVFNRPPHGVRKIVLATNIAETSITIDDIVYVIDCGKIKMTNFDPKLNISTLQPEWVAMSNILQRRGRAGRTQPGVCFHLVSKCMMSKLDLHQLPEMLRTRLEEIILKIKILKLGLVKPFLAKAMQPPNLQTVELSLDLLYKINALSDSERLSPLGYHLASLPMDPHLGKMILFGSIFSCLDPILSIAATLSFKDPFNVPFGKEKDVDQKRKQLAEETQSDHLMLTKVLREWERAEKHGNGQGYCHQNFLSINTVKMLIKLKQQFASYLHTLKFLECENYKRPTYNVNSGNEMLIKAVVCAGLYPNVAKIFKKESNSRKARHDYGSSFKLTTSDRNTVQLHMKSVNEKEKNPRGQWMVYHLKIKSTQVFLYDSTILDSYPLLLFGGKLEVFQFRNQYCISVDNWIKFSCREETARLIKDLRAQLDDMLQFKFSNPGVTNWSSNTKEGSLLQCIVDLISSEGSSRGPPKHRNDLPSTSSSQGFPHERSNF